MSIILSFEDFPIFSTNRKAGKDVELANKPSSLVAKRSSCDSGENPELRSGESHETEEISALES